MKIQHPYIARQCFNAYGKRYCCLNREQRVKLALLRTYYTPKVGGPICKKCPNYIKTVKECGTEMVLCKWMSKKERRVYEEINKR